MADYLEHSERHRNHRQPRDRRVDHDPATGVNAGPPSDRDGADDAPDEAKGPSTPAPVAVSCNRRPHYGDECECVARQVEADIAEQAVGHRLEAVTAWAEDYFGDSTLFPSGLAFALWTDCANPKEVPMNLCPRRQCRGRVPHSLLVHWFGWVRR